MFDLATTQRLVSAYIRGQTEGDCESLDSLQRMSVYRDLVYDSFEALLKRCFPVLQLLLAEQWYNLVKKFICNHSPVTPYFNRLPAEFLNFIDQQDDLPAYSYELAHYEWVELDLEIAVNERIQPLITSAIQLNDVVKLSELTRLLQYHYPVHEVSGETESINRLKQPLYLFRFRDANYKIITTILNPVTARLLYDIKDNSTDTIKNQLDAIMLEIDYQHDAAILYRAAITMLNDFASSGVIYRL